jgi:hypothetical protein
MEDDKEGRAVAAAGMSIGGAVASGDELSGPRDDAFIFEPGALAALTADGGCNDDAADVGVAASDPTAAACDPTAATAADPELNLDLDAANQPAIARRASADTRRATVPMRIRVSAGQARAISGVTAPSAAS